MREGMGAAVAVFSPYTAYLEPILGSDRMMITAVTTRRHVVSRQSEWRQKSGGKRGEMEAAKREK